MSTTLIEVSENLLIEYPLLNSFEKGLTIAQRPDLYSRKSSGYSYIFGLYHLSSDSKIKVEIRNAIRWRKWRLRVIGASIREMREIGVLTRQIKRLQAREARSLYRELLALIDYCDTI
jgi:hypothetical protein